MDNPKNNWNKSSGLFLEIGLAISLGLVLMAFEWKSFEAKPLVTLGELEVEEVEVIDAIRTKHKIPPKPKVAPEVIEVPDNEEIEKEIDIVFEVDDDYEVADLFDESTEEEPEEKVDDAPFIVVEQNAAPEGGMKTFYKFMGKKMKYPKQARRMGVEGKVYLQFVIEKDGSFTDIKVVRGIGAGCDQEALRVLKLAPKWNPAKQRGKVVRQRMVVPIKFSLG